MKTLYLHIGLPKTGTTAIQQFCYKNANTLSERGLTYVEYGRDILPINHKYLWLSFLDYLGGQPNAKTASQKIDVAPLDTALSGLRDEIMSSSSHQFLVSFEGFSAITLYPDKAEAALTRLRDTLADICEVVIICYFRDPWKTLLSNYNQRCKGSPFTPPFIDWVMTAGRATLNQKTIIDTFEKVFRRGVLKLYGDIKGGDFIINFFNDLGVDASELKSVVNANERLFTDKLEASRIRHNISGVVPDTHVGKMVYGRLQPAENEWTAFLRQLDTANCENAILFKNLFGSNLKPVTVADLIWTERQINHQAPTELFLSSL